MTDKETIQALECCKSLDTETCKSCILGFKSRHPNYNCINELCENALDLIKRQQAEIERLQQETRNTNDLRLEIFENKSVWERLARAEAIKEFAERLCEGRVSNDPVVIAVKCELKER